MRLPAGRLCDRQGASLSVAARRSPVSALVHHDAHPLRPRARSERRAPPIAEPPGGLPHRALESVGRLPRGDGAAGDAAARRVDFDFGERGEVDGFDAWRLGEFASGRLARYGFTRRKAIERAVEEAVAAGLVRVDGPMRYLAPQDDGLP
ncbi:MAG: hypothetical protein U0324_06915 [Polyangiales bacterium]